MTRFLLVRHGGQEQLVTEATVPFETNLHDAFTRHPELFPTDELNLGPLLVVGREVQFESGRADLICADEGGQVVIVEFKKGTENPDARRVVAQMLDYGSHLWGWSFDDFEAKIALPFFRAYWSASPKPASLREAAGTRFDFSASDGGVETFAQGVADTLTSGAFVYLVVARTLPPALERVLDYLDAISQVKTAAIVVDYFQDQDRQILVPRVVTATTVTATTSRPPRGRKTDPQQFLQEVGPSEPFWSNLLQFLDGLPGEFYWGQKGFSFRVVLQGKQYAFIWGYPRTVWWLEGRDKGDQLSVLVEPAADRPAALKRLVTTTLGGLREDPSAQSEREGGAILASYYVHDDLDPAVMERLQERVNALFQAANQAGGLASESDQVRL